MERCKECGQEICKCRFPEDCSEKEYSTDNVGKLLTNWRKAIKTLTNKNQPRKFRKKPVTIEAMQFEFSTSCIEALKKFAGESVISVSKGPNDTVGYAFIKTLEDGPNDEVRHVATEGDWIIRGIHGEFYPCKNAIFQATYEEIE